MHELRRLHPVSPCNCLVRHLQQPAPRALTFSTPSRVRHSACQSYRRPAMPEALRNAAARSADKYDSAGDGKGRARSTAARQRCQVRHGSNTNKERAEAERCTCACASRLPQQQASCRCASWTIPTDHCRVGRQQGAAVWPACRRLPAQRRRRIPPRCLARALAAQRAAARPAPRLLLLPPPRRAAAAGLHVLRQQGQVAVRLFVLAVLAVPFAVHCGRAESRNGQFWDGRALWRAGS